MLQVLNPLACIATLKLFPRFVLSNAFKSHDRISGQNVILPLCAILCAIQCVMEAYSSYIYCACTDLYIKRFKQL